MPQQTATCLHGLPADITLAPAPLLVCNEDHRFLVASQLMDVGLSGATILLDPVARNTAPALMAEVTHGDRCFRLHEKESTYIPVGRTLRQRNPGAEPLEIIEIQSDACLGEDDVVRLDDAYGRTERVQ